MIHGLTTRTRRNLSLLGAHDPFSPTDEELFLCWKHGDEAALDALFKRYLAPLTIRASRTLRHRHDAVEVAYQALRSAAQGFDPTLGRFGPRVAVKFVGQLLGRYRALARMPSPVEPTELHDIGAASDHATDTVAALWIGELEPRIRVQLDRLEPHLRERRRWVVELFFTDLSLTGRAIIDHASGKELAARFGCSASQITRDRKWLVGLLAELAADVLA